MSRNWVLVGAPNVGKSSVFNTLTGLSAKVVNYPGSTMDFLVGQFKDVQLIDSPGIYSLDALTEDEFLTLALLQEKSTLGTIEGYILVMDITQIERQWNLFKEVKALGKPLIVILTMQDLMNKMKINWDSQKLAALFGTPVFITSSLVPEKKEDLKYQLLHFINNKDLIVSHEVDEKGLTQELNKFNSHLSVGAETWSFKLDQLALHPLWGLILFIAVMFTLFSSIFWLAAPFMDLFEGSLLSVGTWVSEWPSFWGQVFLTEAVFPGLASFVVFVPQIFILFFLIYILESSGYLARAALTLDSVLRCFGLSGRAFVPLLSGFACAIPASMAARQLSDKRERNLVRWIIPLLTCSARIPVFMMFVELLLPNSSHFNKGFLLLGFYLLSIVIAGIASYILNQMLPQSQGSWLAIDLPWYRRPLLRQALLQALRRSWAFVKRAGPPIFVISLTLWGLSRYPLQEGQAPPIENSYLGFIGQAMDPVFQPMGGDGRVGIAILAAFAAREVFVSTLAMIFEIESEELNAPLLEKLQGATQVSTGEPLFSIPSVWALVIFFIIALQCLTTVATQAQEVNSWKFALTQLMVFNSVAYVLAICTYQVLKIFW